MLSCPVCLDSFGDSLESVASLRVSHYSLVARRQNMATFCSCLESRALALGYGETGRLLSYAGKCGNETHCRATLPTSSLGGLPAVPLIEPDPTDMVTAAFKSIPVRTTPVRWDSSHTLRDEGVL